MNMLTRGQGGERRTENAYVLHPARRFAVHFDPGGGAARRVVAPAAGELEAVVELAEPVRVRLRVRLSDSEFLFLEGLVPDSVGVTAGTRLAPGDPLGEVGDFGLLLHLQDTDRPELGDGIPQRFESYEAGGRAVKRGSPRRGQRVKSSI